MTDQVGGRTGCDLEKGLRVSGGNSLKQTASIGTPYLLEKVKNTPIAVTEITHSTLVFVCNSQPVYRRKVKEEHRSSVACSRWVPGSISSNVSQSHYRC